MQQILVSNRSRPQVNPIKARYCQSFLCQLRGLTFRGSLAVDEGLLLVQNTDTRFNAAIHMMFMMIDLSVIWINSSYNVVDIRLARRWRPVYVPVSPAKYVLECSVERIDDFQVGEKLEFQDHPEQ